MNDYGEIEKKVLKRSYKADLDKQVDKIIDRKSKEVDPDYLVKSHSVSFLLSVLWLVLAFILIALQPDRFVYFAENLSSAGDLPLVASIAIFFGLHGIVLSLLNLYQAWKEKKILDAWSREEE
jgi:H+/Cl- antiporter ClcA